MYFLLCLNTSLSRRSVICMWTEDRLYDRRQIIALYGGALDNDRRVSGRIPRELGRVYYCRSNITLSSLLVDRLENHRSWQQRYLHQMPGIDSRILLHDAIIHLAKYRRLFLLIRERIPDPSNSIPARTDVDKINKRNIKSCTRRNSISTTSYNSIFIFSQNRFLQSTFLLYAAQNM